MMEVVMSLTIAIYNIAIGLFAYKALSGFDYKSAMSEKNPDTIAARAQAAVQVVDAQARLVAAQAANLQQDQGTGNPPAPVTSPSLPDPETSSYSRITGMFGLIIMAAFLWALGNSLIYSMFIAADNVSKIMSGIGTFFLSGSALFAPYAFNQIKDALK